MSLVTALFALLLSFGHSGTVAVHGNTFAASHATTAASTSRCTSAQCYHGGGGILGGLIL